MRRLLLLALAGAAAVAVSACGADVNINTIIGANQSGTESVAFSISQSDLQQENMTGTQMEAFLAKAAPPGVVLVSASPSSNPATFDFAYQFRNFADLQHEESLMMAGGTPSDALEVQRVTPFVTRYSYSSNTNPQSLVQWALNAAQQANLPNQGDFINSVTSSVQVPGSQGDPTQQTVVGDTAASVTINVVNRVGILGSASQTVALTWDTTQTALPDVKAFFAKHVPKGGAWSYSTLKDGQSEATLTASAASWPALSRAMVPVFQEALSLRQGKLASLFQRHETLVGSMDPILWLGSVQNTSGQTVVTTAVFGLQTSAPLAATKRTTLQASAMNAVAVPLVVVDPGQVGKVALVAVAAVLVIIALASRRIRSAILRPFQAVARQDIRDVTYAETAAGATAPAAKFCGQCGEPLEPGARFCGACGSPVS